MKPEELELFARDLVTLFETMFELLDSEEELPNTVVITLTRELVEAKAKLEQHVREKHAKELEEKR